MTRPNLSVRRLSYPFRLMIMPDLPSWPHFMAGSANIATGWGDFSACLRSVAIYVDLVTIDLIVKSLAWDLKQVERLLDASMGQLKS